MFNWIKWKKLYYITTLVFHQFGIKNKKYHCFPENLTNPYIYSVHPVSFIRTLPTDRGSIALQYTAKSQKVLMFLNFRQFEARGVLNF